jgi:hypothetical protein
VINFDVWVWKLRSSKSGQVECNRLAVVLLPQLSRDLKRDQRSHAMPIESKWAIQVGSNSIGKYLN